MPVCEPLKVNVALVDAPFVLKTQWIQPVVVLQPAEVLLQSKESLPRPSQVYLYVGIVGGVMGLDVGGGVGRGEGRGGVGRGEGRMPWRLKPSSMP